VKLFSFPTGRFSLIAVFITLSACSMDAELRQFRDAIPAQIEGIGWPALSPIGDFAPSTDIVPIPDPRSLAQRAADLRLRANNLRGPVLEPSRKRAMRAALARYYQG